MARQLSLAVAWGCTITVVACVIAMVYFAIDIHAFENVGVKNLGFSIQWNSVHTQQWYGVWMLTVAYLGIGLWGLFYLRRAFLGFAAGEFFNRSNSRDLRLFAMLLFAQAAAKVLHTSLCSLVLSINHPPGQKMLAISFGSHELQLIALALILWVISDLLVKGAELEQENKQFV
ncbi:MAG: hypothetical protein Cons2KO_04660 [Congregibacter sp.]